jgi:hypothetical protein
MNKDCIICGSPLKSFNRQQDIKADDVICPNCGQYRIPFSLYFDLKRTPYSETAYNMASYRVFNASYYAQVPKELSKADFDVTEELTTLQKLYSLACYIYIAEARKEKASFRPAACCSNKKGAEEILDALQDMKVIKIDEVYGQPGGRSGSRQRMIMSIRLTTPARIQFEKGMNSPEKFEEVFMSDKKPLISIKTEGDNSPVLAPIDHSTANLAINAPTTTITAQQIKDALLQGGASQDDIDIAEPYITMIADEGNKQQPDKDKLQKSGKGLAKIIPFFAWSWAKAQFPLVQAFSDTVDYVKG